MAGLNPGQTVLGALTPYRPLPSEMLGEHKAGASRLPPWLEESGDKLSHASTPLQMPPAALWGFPWGNFLTWGWLQPGALPLTCLGSVLAWISLTFLARQSGRKSRVLLPQDTRQANKTKTPPYVLFLPTCRFLAGHPTFSNMDLLALC